MTAFSRPRPARRMYRARVLLTSLALLAAACAAPDTSAPPDRSPDAARATLPAPATTEAGATSGPTASPADETTRPTDGTLSPTVPPPATLPSPVAETPPPEATPPPLPTEPTEPVPVDASLTPALQAVLDDWLVEDGAPGAVLGVRLANGRTAVVAGGETDAGTGRSIDPGNRFRIGSITKTFVAALVVQLAEEGLLDLTDELARHVPDAPHAEQVTIRQLLDHTSGIADFAAVPAYRMGLLRAPGREWTPQDVLDLVAPAALDFEPGQGWRYSNTNYLLLGMVAEVVAGDSLAALLRQRIYQPLDLGSAHLEGMEESPALAVSGHFDIDGDGTPDNVRAIPYTALVTSGAAAGAISASALDVLDFASGLFSDRLVSPDGLAEMMRRSPSSNRYGAGLALFEPAGVEAWGHSGALPGFSTLLVHSLSADVTIVAMANETGADVGSLVARTMALVGSEQGGGDGGRGVIMSRWAPAGALPHPAVHGTF